MYLMTYFRTGVEALHLAASEDGLCWQPLYGNRPVLESYLGARSIRDPYLFRDPTGVFHLLSTDGWSSHSILHSSSDDLRIWSEQRLIPVMEGMAGVRNCWAPECFHDVEAGVFRVIWSSATGSITHENDWNHRIWSCATTDFRTFSDPAIFFDPGYSVIDATVVRGDGEYVMAFKDERGENRRGTDHKAIAIARSRCGAGPFEEISDFVTPALSEGPILFRRGNEWILIFDRFMDDRFEAMRSTDARFWSPITEGLSFPPGLRHAAVLELPDPFVSSLVAFYNAWNGRD